ncbi:Permease of the drug/metabolite transporter (DMT) superfamily [Ruegeria halocynthiae]|uniref:Permease of the drug/metabolite transporter (DMT) superfamily n=1 Tax=Ruegeria halocynthiae TaxID=985054 RepID=A0A1H3CS61_9RHOB|nr:DMT family transporter [Ruegeria halocynthiae]SDX57082.1 Permease of the drug/metabolite transporter (DMT) superfamily [Ruegeria halocynthiae]
MALKYWLVICILGIGWGMSFMFNAILLRELGPLSVSMGRVAFGALGCWLYVIGARLPVRLTMARAVGLLGFGALSYAAPFAFYALGQQQIASGVAGIVNATTPAFAVIVSHFWPGSERATLLKSLGVICGFTGIVVLSLPVLNAGATSEFWAILLILCAPVCYAFSLNIARSFRDMQPVVLVALALTGATLAIAPLALWREGLPHITRVETWASLLMIGFVLTSAAFIAFYWLLPKVGPTNISTVTLIAPISALVLGTSVLGEALLPEHLLGMAAIFAGLLLIDGRIVRRWRADKGNKDQPKG